MLGRVMEKATNNPHQAGVAEAPAPHSLEPEPPSTETRNTTHAESNNVQADHVVNGTEAKPGHEEKSGGTEGKNHADPFTVHVAVQAYDYEIERGNSVLPARKRNVPSKWRDYKDPDELTEDDPQDEDYKPVKITSTGRGRGRPRKVIKLEKVTDTEEPSDAAASEAAPITVAHSEASASPTKHSKSQRGRKRKYLNFTEEELQEKRPHRCKEKDCGQTFVSQNALQRHRSMKHENPDSCMQSGTQTSTGNISEKNLMCGHCNRLFSQLGNMKAHLRTHTSEKPYECDDCKNTFMTAESLKRHKMSHLGIKPFECDICMKKFASNVALKEHKSRHSDSKPYECDVCKKKFRQVSVYKRHLVTHSDNKPFTCDICNRTFSQAIYLRSHMKTHTGERPYKCDLCEKRFAHASDKTRHQKTHSGKKPYSCHVCRANFTDPSSCRRHVKEHSETQNHTCDICGEYFKRKLSLRTHMNRRHGGNSVLSSVQPIVTDGGDGTEQNVQLRLMGDNHIFLFSPSGQPISRFAQVMDKDGQKILSEVEHIEGVPDGILPPGTTIIGKGSDSTIEQVLQMSGSGDAPPGELSSATHNLQQEIDTQGTAQIGEHPLQVAYEVIHDDESQQIVEIQYQNEALEPGQFAEVHSEQISDEQGAIRLQEVDVEGKPVSHGYVALEIENYDAASVAKIASSVEIVKQEHEYAQPVDEQGVILAQSYDNEGESIQQIAAQENAHQMAPEDSSPQQISRTENSIHPLLTLHGADQIITSGGSGEVSYHVVDQSNNSYEETVAEQEQSEEAEHTSLQDNSEMDDDATRLQEAAGAPDDAPVLGLSGSVLNSEITRNFVSKPNFASQDYYNWLSAFTDQCKQVELPLTRAIFTDINHVHKTLADMMANPEGILAHKDNFRILMSISQDLNAIINQHLMCVFQQLEEQDR